MKPNCDSSPQLETILEKLKAAGPGPLLQELKATDPVTGDYVLRASCSVWNQLERVPMAPHQRETLQMMTLTMAVVASLLAAQRLSD